MKYLVHLLLVGLLFTACGGTDDGEGEGAAVETGPLSLAESAVVKEVFTTFTTDIAKSDTNATTLINTLSTTLKTAAETTSAEDDPDLYTALAFLEVFELLNGPIMQGIIEIDLADYENIVPQLATAFEKLSFNSLLQDGFAEKFPSFAHKSAVAFKNLSDRLDKSFPTERHVFQYWIDPGLVYNDGLALRAASVGTAFMLDFMASYSYGNTTDYVHPVEDPVSVLNTGNVFVFDEVNGTSRLANAKKYLIESLELMQKLDVDALPQTDGITYSSYVKYADDILENLQSTTPTEDIWKYDPGFGIPYIFMNFSALFDVENKTYIDIEDFTGDSNISFKYGCVKASESYDLNKSLEKNTSWCQTDSAFILFYEAPNAAVSNLDEFITKINGAYTGYKDLKGQDFLDQLNDMIKLAY